MGSVSIVRASAGSGKTYLLAVEYIAAAMRHPTAYRSILAVTFTNKATAEMKRRILTELSSLAQGEQGGFFDSIAERTAYTPDQIKQRAAATLAAILRDYSSFAVSTIDKFFQRIVRSFFRELGLDLHYQIQIDSSDTLHEAIDAVIDRSHGDGELTRKINRIVAEELDAGRRVDPHGALEQLAKVILNEQYAPSTADDRAIDATFDSLKDQYHTAVELLRSKATEACRLIADEGLSVDDFKSKNRGFASYFYKVSRARGTTIPAYSPTFAKTAASGDPSFYATQATIDRVRPILQKLMRLTAEVMRIYDSTKPIRATFEAIAASYSRYMLLRHLSEEFLSILAQRGQLSLSNTSKLIASIVDGADVPFIFERLGSRYSTIFIDEFQDTSLGQWEGFLPLLHEAIAGCDKRCVMLIGDIKQAIYRFRGGDWRLLGGVADKEFDGFIESSTALTTSWRSERKIVEFNNGVMRAVIDSANSMIDEFLADSRVATDHLHHILADAYNDMEQRMPPSKGDGGYVEIHQAHTEAIIEWTVGKVRDIATRHKLCRTAIIVRKAAEGRLIASALIDAGINIISDELLTVGNSATVALIIDLLRYATAPSEIALASINRYFGRSFTAALADREQEFISSLRSTTSIEAFESIIRFFDLHQREPFYLQSLYNIIYTHSTEESTDIASFVEAWDRSLANKKVALPEIQNAITIITIHKAKGLEFDAVIVPFSNWGLFPSTSYFQPTTIWATSDIEPYDKFNPLPLTYRDELTDTIYASEYYEQGVSSVVDNVNLIYVALTRAKSELYIGLSEAPRAKTAGALLTNAATDYLGDTQTIGELTTPIATDGVEVIETIEFNRFESFPPPPLAMQEAQ